MSDDEDCVGLPRIFLNLSAHDASSFSIPSAEEVASQRHREGENERKLKELRARLSDDEDGALAGHDSSSSESDAALAAAAAGLRVEPAGLRVEPPAPRPAPSAAELLAALAPRLAAPARALLLQPGVARRLPEAVAAASSLVAADEEPWSDDDVCATGALLAAAALAHDGRPRGPARRALHTLLEQRASPRQAQALGRALLAALPALELADALAGGGPACAALSARVLDAALLQLLEGAPAAAGPAELPRLARALAAGWARLDAARRYGALQLLGRRLAARAPAAAERAARAALLAPLAQLAPGRDAHHPDELKVLVAASKLRLLFGAD